MLAIAHALCSIPGSGRRAREKRRRGSRSTTSRAPMTNKPPRIPNKPVGATYRCVLHDQNYSPLAGVAMSVVGGRSAGAPVPRAGDRCTCCDAPTTRTQAVDASSDRIHVQPFPMSVCEACASHAVRSGAVEALLGALAGMLGAVAILASVLAPLWLAIAGWLPIAAVVWALIRRGGARRAMVRGGHHAGLAIQARPGMTVVKTSNRRLVEELIALRGHWDAYVE